MRIQRPALLPSRLAVRDSDGRYVGDIRNGIRLGSFAWVCSLCSRGGSEGSPSVEEAERRLLGHVLRKHGGKG